MLLTKIDSKVFKLIQGDITQQETDAIVNAANNRLAPGGGVAGAIHNAAGPMLWEECRKVGFCATGEAKITRGYNLKAEHIIHTVGPVYTGAPTDSVFLADCYRNTLHLAAENNIKSIAFPAISTGVYHFPLEQATKIAIRETKEFLEKNKSIEKVIFVCFDENTYQIYKKYL